MSETPGTPQAHRVEVTIEAGDADAFFLARVARTALKAEAVDPTLALSLIVMDDAAIRTLHREHLGLDRPTDVIAFPLHEPGDEDDLLGEIYVSAETAAREAATRDRSAQEELALYVVHGVLHLVGWGDGDEAARERMARREAEILSTLGLPGR